MYFKVTISASVYQAFQLMLVAVWPGHAPAVW